MLVPASGAAAAREALLQEALPVVGGRAPGAAAAAGAGRRPGGVDRLVVAVLALVALVAVVALVGMELVG